MKGMGFLYTDDQGAELYEDDSDYGADPFGNVGGGGYYSDGLDFDALYGGDGGGGYYSDGLDFDALYGGGGGGESDLYFDYLNYYLGQGYDPFTADQYAWENAQGPAFQLQGEGQLPTPQLPSIGDWLHVPFVPVLPDIWNTYIPNFPDLPAPPPPPAKEPTKKGPCNTDDGLPPACYGPTYHPTWDPCICVPYPPSPKPVAQQPKPPTIPASKPPSQQSGSAPKPPTQQQTGCPPGYCRHPQTGEWIPTPRGYVCHPQYQVCWPRCTAQGTVFDQAKGQCVPVAQATNPLPGSEPGTELPDGVEDLFAQLKKFPWWLWAALAGVLVLGSQDEGGKKTTVTYKRR